MNNKKRRIIGLLTALVVVVITIFTISTVYAGSNNTYSIYNSQIATTAKVMLLPNMKCTYTDGSGDLNPYNQRSYNLPTRGSENYGCAVTAYITGRNIIYKETLNPHNYVKSDASALCTFNGMKAERSVDNSVIASQVLSGKPVIYKIAYNGGTHYVLIIGLKETGGRSYYYDDELICIDPVGGKICYLTNAWGWSSRKAGSCKIKLY